MPDLFEEQFPYLNRFCNEENIRRVPYEHTYYQLTLKDYVYSSYPTRLNGKMDTVKKMLNDCLEFAYIHNALNLDRRRRLAGTDSTRFWSLINELRVGIWLENQKFKIKFDPPAKNNGIGEFEIISDNQEIFVEVKTIFGDKDMIMQDQLLAKLADHFNKERYPVIGINLLEFPSHINPNDSAVIDSLINDIVTFLSPYFPQLLNEQKIEYNNLDGLIIEFTLLPGSYHTFSRTYGGSMSVENQLKIKLGMSVDGKESRIQVSNKNIPNIIFIYDMAHITDDFIDIVLYGTRTFRTFKDDGLWNIENNNIISAVGIFKEILDKQYNLNVDIYLCPTPRLPLPTILFKDRNIKWLRLSSDGNSIIENMEKKG